jgi:hypothetical protein
MSTRSKNWLFFVAILVAFLLVALWVGVGQALVGAGGFLGVYIAMGAGNKGAREVDEYRRQWLQKRKGQPPRSGDEQAPPNDS